jgi:hypothetical protein
MTEDIFNLNNIYKYIIKKKKKNHLTKFNVPATQTFSFKGTTYCSLGILSLNALSFYS